MRDRNSGMGVLPGRQRGIAASLLKHDLSEEEIGISDLRQVAERILGDPTVSWFWRLPVKSNRRKSAWAFLGQYKEMDSAIRPNKSPLQGLNSESYY